jgi:O-antigen/teichoic acid export membrane protein
VGMTSILLIPAFACTALASRTVVLGLYGDSWMGAVQLLAPLALAMPFRGLMSLAGPVIWGVGKVEQEVYAQTLATLILLILMACAAYFSVVVLAWGVLGASVARFCLMTRIALKLLGICWLDLLKNLRGSFLILAGAAPVVCSVDASLTFMNVPALARLCCVTVSGLAGGLLVFGLWGSWVLSTEMQYILERIWERFPTPLRWFVSLGLTSRK